MAVEGTTAFFRLIEAPPNPDPSRLVWIPPGTFTMGSPLEEADRDSHEGPQTTVTISRGGWIGKHEVTQGDYEALMGSNPSRFSGDPNRPVDRVTWFDATNYCGLLTQSQRASGIVPSNYSYRLPTEAEREYACRAGTTTRFSYGDDVGYAELAHYGWYGAASGGNSDGTTQTVGQLAPNPWGCCDMHGNVAEWCQNWWSERLPGGSVTDPQGPIAGTRRVIRGGDWFHVHIACRSASRGWFTPDLAEDFVGFRVVLALAQP